MTQDLVLSIPGLQALRQQTLGDDEINIAIIDSRVDLSHPAFAGAQLRELMPAWLAARMRPSGASHGTHVASIIFGQPDGPLEGIAPRCRGIIIPVYGETENGELLPCSQGDLGRAISLALDAGADLINISGGELIRPGDVDPLLAKIVRSCDQQDVVIVAATGNEGCQCLHVPASLDTVLAVGAADANGQPMSFSNWDASLASHGVLALGEGIPGAVPGGLATHNGTSFACPIVTGAAALLLSLQKTKGERPSPRVVRDAIVGSASPCTSEDQGQCERLLGGRLNVGGAFETLFEGQGVTPLETLNEGTPVDVIRAPPIDIGHAVVQRSDEESRLRNDNREDIVVSHQQLQAAPQGGPAVNPGMVAQGSDALPGAQAQPPAPGAWVSAASMAPGAAPTTPFATQVPPTPALSQPVGVQPQAAPSGCSCGGAHAQQVIGSSEQAVTSAQQDTATAQQPAPSAYHGGTPVQSPYGARPAFTPGQRTAMMAGYGGSGGGQQMTLPAGRGVAPSQQTVAGGCPCPLPNDFINSSNSQLVYVTGELGYDFITDARRDYFVQHIREMGDEWRANPDLLTGDNPMWPFHDELGILPGDNFIPEDNKAMAAYLFQGEAVSPPVRGQPILAGWPQGRGAADLGAIVFTLIQEGQELYALRPLLTDSEFVLATLAKFLYDQSRSDTIPDPQHPRDTSKAKANPNRSERISVAGRIIGEMTLYNGQQVPILDVSLRALFNWNIDALIRAVLGENIQADDENYTRLENFLQRIYYEVRNLGQAASDRAINYMTTNLFQANEAFKDALKENLELDSIFADKSPLCRPKSDCWDVVMRFFDPNNRLGKALTEYRLTVDVSDISPVGIGKVRKWSRFA